MLKPGQRSRTNKSAEVLCPSKTSDKLACFKILTCFPFLYRYSLEVLGKQRSKVILPFKSNGSSFVNQIHTPLVRFRDVSVKEISQMYNPWPKFYTNVKKRLSLRSHLSQYLVRFPLVTPLLLSPKSTDGKPAPL